MSKHFKSYFAILITVIIIFSMSSCNSSIDTTTNTESTDTTNKYTVSFDLNHDDATGNPSNQLVEPGHTAEEPTNPELDGYIFLGWYTEEECITEFLFTEEITSDITVYAKWEIDDDDDTSQIPDGLTYSDGVVRITAYMNQMSDLLIEGIDAYETTNEDWLGFGPASINLSFLLPLMTTALTTTFGTDDASQEIFELTFAFFDFENIIYIEQNGRYILEYDAEEEGTDYHYGIVVDYNSTIDAGRVILYKEYETESEEIDLSFEFVKTNDGYAIQSSYGQGIFVLDNKEVISFTISIYEDTEERASIYDNPSLIDEDFALLDMQYTMSFDGSNYTYIEKEYDTDLISGETTQYRINTCQFEADGTIIDQTDGEWIPIE